MRLLRCARLLQHYLLFALPLVLAAAAWSQWNDGDGGSRLVGPLRLAWELLSWSLILWFIAALTLMILLVASSSVRKQALRRI